MVTNEAADQPIAVARDSQTSWVLVSSPTQNKVKLVRVPQEGTSSVVWSTDVAPEDRVAGFVRTTEGLAFAITHKRALNGYVLSPAGVVSDKRFPRGEPTPGRDEVTPSLSLAADDHNILNAMVHWPTPYGARRMTSRDVRESRIYAPQRRDRFASPDVLTLGDRVLVAYERHAGTYIESPSAPSRTELAVMDASHVHPDVLATVTLPRDATPGSHPHIAPLDVSSPASGAVVVWRDDGGLVAARVAMQDNHPWQCLQTMRVQDTTVHGEHDVGSAALCGSVVAWRDGDTVSVRAFDVLHGTAGQPVHMNVPSGERVAGQTPRVRIERTGAQTFLAVDATQGPRLFRVAVTAECAATVTPVVLPASASMGSGSRLAGLAATPTVLFAAVTREAPDATETTLGLYQVHTTETPTLPRGTTHVPQAVTEITVFAGDIPVVIGRAHDSVMLQLVGAPGSDDETEDLLLQDMVGNEVSVASSPALHRVWVADIASAQESPFGPPHAVVVQSAIDTLEDGPRTTVRPVSVPYAEMSRYTIERTTYNTQPVWGVTWSGATHGDDCVAGAWASLHAHNTDEPVALGNNNNSSPWPWAMGLIAPEQRTCGDRVLTALWNNTQLVASIVGERVGAQLVFANLSDTTMRNVVLDSRTPTTPRQTALSRVTNGYVAFWLDGDRLSPSLRYRMFSSTGSAVSNVTELGSIAEAPGNTTDTDPLPLDGSNDKYSLLMRTSHGPRLARIECGAAR
jgi:hypothetical protein